MLLLRTLTNPKHNTKGSELSWQEMDQNLVDLYNLLSSVFSTGMTMDFAGGSNDVPVGWLLLDGKTVGSSNSGADYDSSDAEALFKLIWNNTSNSEYQLLDSNGNSVARSATAQDDWDNDYRIPLPDVRGKTVIGSGNTTDTDAAGNPINPRTHLNNYGFQITDVSHSHTLGGASIDTKSFNTLSTTSAGGHFPSGSVTVHSGGSHSHSVTGTTDLAGGHTPSGSVTVGLNKAYPDGSSPIEDHITTQVTEGAEPTITVVTDPTHVMKSSNNNPPHDHPAGFSGDSVPDHDHQISVSTSSSGSHSHTASFSGDQVSDHSHNVDIPDHSHSISGSTDSALTNIDMTQPSIAMNKIIKL